MIPKNILRQHILQAIHKIDQDGVPSKREARGYWLVFEGKKYPPKYLVALANSFANGSFLSSQDFNGGSETNDFLRSREFMITPMSAGDQLRPPIIKKTRPNKPQERIRHDERCPECKKIVGIILAKLYGRVEKNHRFDAGVSPDDYRDSPFHPYLERIFQTLRNHRGHQSFTFSSNLPGVDYFVPEPGFIVEFDESQHFTACRKLTLLDYPPELKLGYDKNKWMDLCDKTNASDNKPPYRDEQRAWYDTLRDFLPSTKSLLPTVRLYSKSFRWCSLDPDNPTDVKRFKAMLEGKASSWNIEFRKDPNPTLGRIIIAGEWNGSVETSKQLLHAVCANWPAGVRTQFLITCGAFLTFDWPVSMPEIEDNKFPDQSVIDKLVSQAEKKCRELIDEELQKKLLCVTDFITIGVDSHKEKISVSNAQIRQPHVEMVAMIDLQTGTYYWTGKSYPTPGQEDGLVRFQDLNSHFLTTKFGKVMLLGCHDLNIFSLRGAKVARKEWRRQVRQDFYDLAMSEKPVVVLHHPHTTDSSRIWTAAWNELSKTLPTVESYIGSGRYYWKGKQQRSDIIDVLGRTKMGDTLDVVVWLDQ